jgi:hypothetical protein
MPTERLPKAFAGWDEPMFNLRHPYYRQWERLRSIRGGAPMAPEQQLQIPEPEKKLGLVVVIIMDPENRTER